MSTGNRTSTVLTLAAVAMVALCMSAAAARAAFVAYHDLGGVASPGNITTQPDLATTVDLIRFSDGADTGVDFSIAGANGIDLRTGTVTRPPASGTPAGDLFLASGVDLDDGLVYEGGNSGSGSTTFTFTNLTPGLRYDVALYGDRNTTADGVERFTLGGADGATNSSSTGIDSTFITDMQTRPNAPAGHVVRWTDIDPGTDGAITIDIDPEFTSPSNIAYLSAVRLAEVPEPATMGLLALGVLGVLTRRRKRA